ncbi:MAG TPA: biotin/lipoyl-containing protein, partial [Burkholderiales bacterium]|nr:biotin/lipoyl-containing protein [Burkholderiales bacterium]
MIEFKLPSLGADMDQGKLLEWKIGAGDRVKRGDIVAVVDTTKAAVEVEIWDEGVVHEILVQPGETIPVGTVMALLLAPGESAPPPGAKPAAAARPKVAAAPTARQRVSPAARKRAAELGVALEGIAGTGPEGSVTLQDVERAAAAPAAKAPAADRATEMRRAIAAAMSRSKREIPHYYLSETVPLAAALAWLQRQNAERPVTERLLIAALYLKAVALACGKYPEMNGHFREGAF